MVKHHRQPWKGLRIAVALISFTAAVLFIATPRPAHATEPIEGTWNYNGGQVLVEPTGTSTYKGTVVVETTFSNCPHLVGERMWEIRGSGTYYEGTHLWFDSNDCATSGRTPGHSTWTVIQSGSSLILKDCSTSPGDPSDIRCNDLTQAYPPQKPKLDDIAKLPSRKKCVSRRKFRIRLRNPKGSALRKATVKVNRKKAKVLKGKRLKAAINLRGLPKGRFTVEIKAVTVTGKTIKGKRRYRTCVKKRRSGRTPEL